MIEGVVSLQPQLRTVPLAHREVLREGQIGVVDPRSVEEVSLRVAEKLADCLRSKVLCGEIEVRLRGSANRSAGGVPRVRELQVIIKHVRSIRARIVAVLIAGERVVNRGLRQRDWKSGREGGDPEDVHATEQGAGDSAPARRQHQFVIVRENQPMACVILAVSIVKISELRVGVDAARSEAAVLKTGRIVQCVAVGVGSRGLEAMGRLLVQRDLGGVVVGASIGVLLTVGGEDISRQNRMRRELEVLS